MTPQRKLFLIARNLDDVADDLRHRLLDVSDDLINLSDCFTESPKHLQNELHELIEELRAVQPQFSSHRSTSSLFDREGLGQAGRQQAKLIAQRIISLAGELSKE